MELGYFFSLFFFFPLSKAGQICLIEGSYLDTYNYSVMLVTQGRKPCTCRGTLRAETQRPASWGPKAGLKQA
ncbi:hypothetical protein F4818DRAFT_418610 [Hypoxylon cercidicola]|nr:hypothetical protein F4818DRAFT_418610 [Hypoxylon cercidicola]